MKKAPIAVISTQAPLQKLHSAPATQGASPGGTSKPREPRVRSHDANANGGSTNGAKVSDKTGLKIKTVVATEYAGVIEAMCNGQAQMGALNTFGYILASSRKCADVALVSVRNNSTSYKGQIITKADSGIKKLTDLKGKTFCRPDPLSTSGWIIPSITLKANGINPDTDLKVVDVGGHDVYTVPNSGVTRGDDTWWIDVGEPPDSGVTTEHGAGVDRADGGVSLP